MEEPLNLNYGGQTPPPQNYIVWAILSTIFCCPPIGIVSIVFAAQVNSKWIAGDADGAYSSSKNARTWAWVAFGVGFIFYIVYMALIFLGIFSAAFMDIVRNW